MSLIEPRYRPNVAAIIRNPLGEILICERLDSAGAWQFPQGGVEEGEAPETALVRELWEEVGLPPGAFRMAERKGPYRYLFAGQRMKKGYHGQEQTYFLVDLVPGGGTVDIATENPEFRSCRWIKPERFRLAWLPEFKRAVYQAVLRDFFGVTLGADDK